MSEDYEDFSEELSTDDIVNVLVGYFEECNQSYNLLYVMDIANKIFEDFESGIAQDPHYSDNR